MLKTPLVAPAVLVVADQRAVRVGRQRRLPGSREPEEDRHPTVLRADVRRAVHRQHVRSWEAVVHQAEDPLLDLARVEGAADQDLAARRVEHDERPRARAVLLGGSLDVGCVEDESVDREPPELAGRRHDEHRLRKERVVRARGHHPHPDAMVRVGAGEVVDDIQRITAGEVLGDLRAQAVEMLLGQRVVHGAPPDAVARPVLVDDELVLRRAAGEASGIDDECAAVGELPVAVRERVGVELGCGGVVDHTAAWRDAVRMESRVRYRRGHSRSPRSKLRRPRRTRSRSTANGSRNRATLAVPDVVPVRSRTDMGQTPS